MMSGRPAHVVVAFYNAAGGIEERPAVLDGTDTAALQRFVDHFEQSDGIIQTIYCGDTCLFRGMATIADVCTS